MLGDRIRIGRTRANLKQAEVAELLGVNAITVSRWERGVNIPGAEVVKNIAKILNVTVEWLVNNDDTTSERLSENASWLIDQERSNAKDIPDSNACPIELVWVPVVTSAVKVCCGTGNMYPEEVIWEETGRYPIPFHMLNGYIWQVGENGFRVISVEGDSMEPRIYDGDLLVFANLQLSSGDLGVVKYKGRLMVRGLVFEKERTRLRPLNKDYEEILVDVEEDEFCILGKVLLRLPKAERMSSIW